MEKEAKELRKIRASGAFSAVYFISSLKKDAE